MSEHDIEQATEESYRRFPDCGSTRYGFIEGFRSGLPLLASAREEGAREQWQDISTAPKDGTKIDLWVPGNWPGGKARRLPDCVWREDCWEQHYAEVSGPTFGIDEEPTHWMLLPPPPSLKEG